MNLMGSPRKIGKLINEASLHRNKGHLMRSVHDNWRHSSNSGSMRSIHANKPSSMKKPYMRKGRSVLRSNKIDASFRYNMLPNSPNSASNVLINKNVDGHPASFVGGSNTQNL